MLIRIRNHHSDNRIVQIMGSRRKLRLPPYGEIEIDIPEAAYLHLREYYRRVDPAMEIDVLLEDAKPQHVPLVQEVDDMRPTATDAQPSDAAEPSIDDMHAASAASDEPLLAAEPPKPKKSKRGRAK